MTNTAWLGSIVCAQMLQLVKFGIVWICGELEHNRGYSSSTNCGRDHRGEHSSLLRLWKKSQIVSIPVTQIEEEDHRGEYSQFHKNVEEIAEVSKSSSE